MIKQPSHRSLIHTLLAYWRKLLAPPSPRRARNLGSEYFVVWNVNHREGTGVQTARHVLVPSLCITGQQHARRTVGEDTPILENTAPYRKPGRLRLQTKQAEVLTSEGLY